MKARPLQVGGRVVCVSEIGLSMVTGCDVVLILIGAGIGLVCSLLMAIVQHTLSLRADMVKREHDRLEREEQRRRQSLTEGVPEHSRQLVREALIDQTVETFKREFREPRLRRRKPGQGHSVVDDKTS